MRRTSASIVWKARELRRPLTPAEQMLWNELRGRRFAGIKFRRQHAVGHFILDFYCPEYRLAIELDGDTHLEQQEYDAIRTEVIESFACHVIRFRNEEIFDNLPAVLSRIRAVLTLLGSRKFDDSIT
jgi:very-short-patch-repair endonuclease